MLGRLLHELGNEVLDFSLKKVSLLCTAHTNRERKRCLTNSEMCGEIEVVVPALQTALFTCQVRNHAGELMLPCYLWVPRLGASTHGIQHI